MAEIDPDLLREWGQMLQGIGEEMVNVANAVDPPTDEYMPNVSIDMSYGMHGEGSPVKPVLVHASQGRAEGLPAIYGELSPMYYSGVPITGPYDRPDYTYHIRTSQQMNHSGTLLQIETNKAQGKIVHVLFFDEQDREVKRVQA